jgi:hypothetical protein
LARRRSEPGTKAPSARSAVQLNDRQRLSWLRLLRSENVGPATFRALVNQFGGAEAALAALPALSRRGGRASIRVFTEAEAEAEVEAADRAGAHLVAMGETGYSPGIDPCRCAARHFFMPRAGSSSRRVPSSPWSAPATVRPWAEIHTPACHRARTRRLRHRFGSSARHRHRRPFCRV